MKLQPAISRLLLLAMAMLFLLGSCNKEEAFDNWLTKKDGQWNITEMTETYVEYLNSDSTVTDPVASTLDIGDFAFEEDGTYSYRIASARLGFDLESEGEKMLNGQTFTDTWSSPTSTGGGNVLTLFGEKLSRRRLSAILRIEWKDVYDELTMAMNLEMTLERAD